MKLHAHGLTVNIQANSPVNIEDWARVSVSVQVNGFMGEITAWLQSVDVKRFAEQISEMQKGLGQPGVARLCSAEPDIDIEFKQNKLGQITGRYCFESERRAGDPTSLTGSFEMDQSYLPELAKGVDLLFRKLGGQNNDQF